MTAFRFQYGWWMQKFSMTPSASESRRQEISCKFSLGIILFVLIGLYYFGLAVGTRLRVSQTRERKRARARGRASREVD